MAFADKLVAIRRAHNLTQEGLAAKLFVTRQAVSRWERGEVTPGIDMMKLIAAVNGEPLSHLLEMPEHYCQSCGMILTPEDCGTDAADTATDHYCKWCYDHGEYTYETTMEAMIEDCAPRLAQNTGMSLDEAVSLMGAVLPQLERWRTVQKNEERYGAEARKRYGNEAIDAANEALLDMDPETWNDMKLFWVSFRLPWALATQRATRPANLSQCTVDGLALTGDTNPKTKHAWASPTAILPTSALSTTTTSPAVPEPRRFWSKLSSRRLTHRPRRLWVFQSKPQPIGDLWLLITSSHCTL